MIKNKVVLIDKEDKEIGLKEKNEAHKNPVSLHRAISVLIFDGDKILMQKRAFSKPTWPGFWTNTVCTNVRPREIYQKAAERRLKEEMGIKTSLKEVCKFIYKEKYNKIWGEHELDHVFIGEYDGKISPNPKEAAGYQWLNLKELKKDLKENPGYYTPWFRIIVKKLKI